MGSAKGIPMQVDRPGAQSRLRRDCRRNARNSARRNPHEPVDEAIRTDLGTRPMRRETPKSDISTGLVVPAAIGRTSDFRASILRKMHFGIGSKGIPNQRAWRNTDNPISRAWTFPLGLTEPGKSVRNSAVGIELDSLSLSDPAAEH